MGFVHANRRGMIARYGIAAGVLAGCACLLPGTEGASAPMTNATPTGDPYALAGKRIVFTNWHYVHPGGFSWVNDKGEGVTVSGSEGPWGAHFRRGEYPHGIRIVAQPAQRVGPVSYTHLTLPTIYSV